MEFDLRTCDSAYYFILNFMNMTGDEYIKELLDSGNDFEKFWNRNYCWIESVDISNLKIMAFHVLGAVDDCKEIKMNGLINLKEVLVGDTNLSRALNGEGIYFDILSKTVCCNGEIYDINYDNYRHSHLLFGIDEKLKSISYRVYYDYCVNGFLVNDNIIAYGTNIHERPEFLITLSALFLNAGKIEYYWKKSSVSYRIDFYASVDQIHRFNFELDELDNPPYGGWLDLSDDMKIKKWMLSHAIDRAFDNLNDVYLYIKDDQYIPPEQIISYTKI